MRAAVTMVEVETEMVWVGDLAKAETLLSATVSYTHLTLPTILRV